MERGELTKAYKDAKALVERHPENAAAHFSLAYVLRYGGAMEESGRQCDAALALDPGNYTFAPALLPSISLVITREPWIFFSSTLGRYGQLATSCGTTFGMEILKRGKSPRNTEIPGRLRMMAACMENPSSAEAVSLTREEAAKVFADRP